MKTRNLIYSIEGLDAEELYNNYVAYLEGQKATRDFTAGDSAVVNAVSEQYLKGFSFKNPGKPSEAITINKFRLLVHLLVSRNHDKENHTLNAKVLKQVIGRNYNIMLRSLEELGVITISDYYIIGLSSYKYTLNAKYEIKIRQNNNVYIQKELEKLNGIFSKNEKSNITVANQDKFLKLYQKNLNKIKLSKFNYSRFINQLPNSQRSKITYHEVVNKLENKLYNLSEDERDRVYNTLTRTPKLLKNFINIKFQLDVKNSHPLLFSYFLIKQYNIINKVINDISTIPYSNIILYHNGGTNLCKYLETSSQKFIKDNKIPDDIILYVYLTSTGRFWDHFQTLSEFSNIPRYLIKVKLFEEVFYSNKLTSWQRDFAKAFQNIYPTVYSTILQFRKEVKESSGEHLAHKMTRLESEIFRKVLQQTWDMSMETVNIHDALIMIDTQKNRDITEAQVDNIIKSVYREYGLLVTTSTDYFSIKQAEEQLQILKNNKDEYQKFIYELKDKIVENENDENTQNYYFKIWEGIENGAIDVKIEDGKPYVLFNT